MNETQPIQDIQQICNKNSNQRIANLGFCADFYLQKIHTNLKIISAPLAAMMSMTMTFTAHANPPKSGQNTQGSQSNALIRISSSSDLGYIRKRLSKGENFEDKTVILENDIYISIEKLQIQRRSC